MLPLWILALVVVTLAFVAVARPPYYVVLAGLFFALIPRGDWQIAGLRLDPEDLAVAAIAFAWIQGRIVSRTSLRNLRMFLVLWGLLGVMMSLAYLYAPINQQHLTDPLRATYQVYRYCWKQIIYLPLAFVLIGSDSRVRHLALLALVLVGDLAAAWATFEGYFGSARFASGPFPSKNALGGGLMIPFIVSLALLIFPRDSNERTFAGISVLVIARGLLFASSRGAFVAIAGAVAMAGFMLIQSPIGRQRIARLAGTAIVTVTVAFIIRPDLLERPTIQRLFSASQGTQASNFQWRLTQRWPHFWEIAKANPILGVGTHVDLTLGEAANTPHNGYLALACIRGLPATTILAVFGIIAIQAGMTIYRKARDSIDKMFGLAAASAIAAILVHNIVESTFLIVFVNKLYWLLTGLVIARRYAGAAATAPAEAPQPAPVSVTGRRLPARRRGPARPPLRRLPPGPSA